MTVCNLRAIYWLQWWKFETNGIPKAKPRNTKTQTHFEWCYRAKQIYLFKNNYCRKKRVQQLLLKNAEWENQTNKFETIWIKLREFFSRNVLNHVLFFSYTKLIPVAQINKYAKLSRVFRHNKMLNIKLCLHLSTFSDI